MIASAASPLAAQPVARTRTTRLLVDRGASYARCPRSARDDAVPPQPGGTSTGTNGAPPAPESLLHARPQRRRTSGGDRKLGRSKLHRSVSVLAALLTGTGAAAVAGNPASAVAGPELKISASD